MVCKDIFQWVSLENPTVKLQRRRLCLWTTMTSLHKSFTTKIHLSHLIPRRTKKKSYIKTYRRKTDQDPVTVFGLVWLERKTTSISVSKSVNSELRGTRANTRKCDTTNRK